MNFGKIATDIGFGLLTKAADALDRHMNGAPLRISRIGAFEGRPPTYSVDVAPGSHRRLVTWLLGHDLPNVMHLTLNGAGPFEFRTYAERKQFAAVYQFAATRAR